MADINIKFTQDSDSGGFSSQFLNDTIQKLNAAIDKLASNAGGGGNFGGGGNYRSSSPFAESSNGMNRAVQEFNLAGEKALKDLGNKIGTTLSTAVGVAVSVGLARYFNNQATAIMGRATASGNFMSAAIMGNANEAFPSYVGALYNTERARQIANNQALYESAYGTGGAVVGAGVGALVGAATGLATGGVGSAIEGAAKGISKGAAGGAAIGAGYGSEQAALVNQNIQKNMMVRGALAQRDAIGSTNEWQAVFSRWNNPMTNFNLAPSALTGGAPVMAPLSTAFENKYGTSQNYLPILQNIAPYLNTNPLDNKNGNLDEVAQNFRKAGFAVNDFGRLTMLSTQYAALTGNNLYKFSQEIINARNQFGNAYDVSTLANSQNLMAIGGYSKQQADQIAYQAQFNPNLMSNVQSYATSSVQQFYINKALSKSVGFDINKALRTGHIDDPKARAEIAKELEDFHAGKSYGKTMTTWSVIGRDPTSLASLIQNQVTTNKDKSQNNQQAGLAPGQTDAATEILDTLRNGLINLRDMNVTATNVNIINGGATNKEGIPSLSYSAEQIKQKMLTTSFHGRGRFPSAPIAYTYNKTPAKK